MPVVEPAEDARAGMSGLDGSELWRRSCLVDGFVDEKVMDGWGMRMTNRWVLGL